MSPLRRSICCRRARLPVKKQGRRNGALVFFWLKTNPYYGFFSTGAAAALSPLAKSPASDQTTFSGLIHFLIAALT